MVNFINTLKNNVKGGKETTIVGSILIISGLFLYSAPLFFETKGEIDTNVIIGLIGLGVWLVVTIKGKFKNGNISE